jgi:hypothetical protein
MVQSCITGIKGERIMEKFQQNKKPVLEGSRGSFARDFFDLSRGIFFSYTPRTTSPSMENKSSKETRERFFTQHQKTLSRTHLHPQQMGPIETKGFHWVERNTITPLLLKSKHGSAQENNVRNLGVRSAIGWGRYSDGLDWISPVVTATTLSLYLQRYTLTKEEECLNKAIQLGRWLVAIQCSNGAFPYAYSIKEKDYLEPLYTFNAGVIINALLQLNSLHPMMMFQKAAIKTGDWLVKSMQCYDGSFKAGVTSGGRLMNMPQGQFGDHGAQHLKLLQCFQHLTQMDNRLFRYKHAFAKLKRWAFCLVRYDGSFPMYPGCKSISTTPHLYAMEGIFGCEKLRVLWDKSLLWTAKTILERDGWLPGTVDGSNDFQLNVGGTAQALRLLTMGLSLCPKESSLYIEAAQLTAFRLEQAQHFSGKWPEHPQDSWWKGADVQTTIHALSALLYWNNLSQKQKWCL